MKPTTETLTFSSMPKTYNGLVSLLVPRPIHDRATYENAVEVVHALAGFKLNRDQDDYLELMAKIIEDYERETVPEPAPVRGIGSLKFLLKENDLTADDLGSIIGVDRSIAYRILKGTRNLTAEHVKKLSSRFAVSADLFLA
jgi:HTH-type transcriptional regulator/antitoxin HigA